MNYLLFALVACFWSGSFIAIEPLVKAMPPLMAGALRMGVAVVFLAAILPAMKIPLSLPKDLRTRVWGTGIVAFGIPFSLLFWGERSISPGLAGILNGTVPIWVFILGLLFTPNAEPFSIRKVIGLSVGISGIIAIFLPKILSSESDPSIWGAVAVGLMAVSYAASVLMNRTIFLKHGKLHPFTNLFHQLISGFIALFLVAAAFEGFPNPTTWSPLSTVIWAELYLGCISTSIAFMMFYQLIKTWGSVRAATVTYLIPAVTLGFDIALNHRMPSTGETLGVLGVTAGVIILNLPASLFSRHAKATA